MREEGEGRGEEGDEGGRRGGRRGEGDGEGGRRKSELPWVNYIPVLTLQSGKSQTEYKACPPPPPI